MTEPMDPLDFVACFTQRTGKKGNENNSKRGQMVRSLRRRGDVLVLTNLQIIQFKENDERN